MVCVWLWLWCTRCFVEKWRLMKGTMITALRVTSSTLITCSSNWNVKVKILKGQSSKRNDSVSNHIFDQTQSIFFFLSQAGLFFSDFKEIFFLFACTVSNSIHWLPQPCTYTWLIISSPGISPAVCGAWSLWRAAETAGLGRSRGTGTAWTRWSSLRGWPGQCAAGRNKHAHICTGAGVMHIHPQIFFPHLILSKTTHFKYTEINNLSVLFFCWSVRQAKVKAAIRDASGKQGKEFTEFCISAVRINSSMNGTTRVQLLSFSLSELS